MKFITKIISGYLDVAFTDDFALFGAIWFWPLFLLLGFNTAIFITVVGMILGTILAITLTIIKEWPVNHNNK